MEELREEIWDLLYEASQPQSVEAIAERLRCPTTLIEQAVAHPWFEVSNGLIAIAKTDQ